MEENNLSKFFEKVTNVKNPFTSIFLDDRAINFDGDYENTFEKIVKFQPYWKRRKF